MKIPTTFFYWGDQLQSGLAYETNPNRIVITLYVFSPDDIL